MVKLISITPDAEKTIMYCARVSNPKNQSSDNTKLLSYCVKNSHWSVFEQANLVVEIVTTRAISAQIIRHKSFFFQEASQRYSEVSSLLKTTPRRQDVKNRQNSIDDLDQSTLDWWDKVQQEVFDLVTKRYHEALDKEIAKECARMILPMCSATKLYMNGTVRSWIHFLMVRLDSATQLEHRLIAQEIWVIFKQELPEIAKILPSINPVFVL